MVTKTTVQNTFQLSITAQLIALLLNIAALTREGANELLRLILVVELVINGVQLAWCHCARTPTTHQP